LEKPSSEMKASKNSTTSPILMWSPVEGLEAALVQSNHTNNRT
jgi:hypothetical protein